MDTDNPNRTQWVMLATADLTPADFNKKMLPLVATEGRTLLEFRADAASIVETVIATYGGDGLPDLELNEVVSDGADILLAQFFTGNYNCFPHAPTYDGSVPGPALEKLRPLGWLLVKNKQSAAFLIDRTILSRARACSRCGDKDGRLPPGYDPTPKRINVTIRLTLSGPITR